MNKKYFDTRKDSLEDKINTIASEQPSISKPQTDVKLSVEKKYFETKKGSLEDLASKLVEEKALSTKGATRKPTSASDRLYLSNPNEHRRRQELEFMYKRILASMPEKERNSKEGKIQAMDMARVRSAKNKKDLTKNMKNKGTLKIADSVTQDDHGEKINQDKKDAAMKKTDQKKDFKSLRAETKIIKLGDGGKTATGKTAGAIDVEPSAKPI